ncbi:MAG: extracellular solute-binding protein [Actinomycetota bacterium]
MRVFTQRRSLIALGLVFAMLAAACSGSGDDSATAERVAQLESELEAAQSADSTDAETIAGLEQQLEDAQAELDEAATTEATAEDVITVEVWSHEFEPLQNALLDKWVPEFEAENPNIKVEVTSIPFAGIVSYDAQLLTALSSGQGPDLWDMGDWSYGPILENGWIAPLDPTIFGYEDNAEFIDAYQPGTLSVLEQDGQMMGVFSEFNTLALFYNKDLIDEVGAEIPADQPLSWDDIGQISSDLRIETDAGVIERVGYQFGFFANFRSPQWYAQNFYALMRQYGQDDLFIDGAPAADTEAVVNALDVIYDYTYEYEAYDPTFISNFFADIPQGRVAMVLAGAWYPGAASPNAPDGEFNFAVAPHPVVDPSDPATYHNVSWLWGWSVNSNSPTDEQVAAQEFMAFMLGKKGETEQPQFWFENLGYLQPSRAFLESDGYTGAVDADPWLQLFIDAFDDYSVEPVPHSFDEPGAALIRAIDRIIYDGATAEEAAATLQAELTRLDG